MCRWLRQYPLLFFVWVKRAYIYKCSFAHPAAAYILEHDGIIFTYIIFKIAQPQTGIEIIFSIRRAGVRVSAITEQDVFQWRLSAHTWR